jgi:hypothetical protein
VKIERRVGFAVIASNLIETHAPSQPVDNPGRRWASDQEEAGRKERQVAERRHPQERLQAPMQIARLAVRAPTGLRQAASLPQQEEAVAAEEQHPVVRQQVEERRSKEDTDNQDIQEDKRLATGLEEAPVGHQQEVPAVEAHQEAAARHQAEQRLRPMMEEEQCHQGVLALHTTRVREADTRRDTRGKREGGSARVCCMVRETTET